MIRDFITVIVTRKMVGLSVSYLDTQQEWGSLTWEEKPCGIDFLNLSKTNFFIKRFGVYEQL